LKVKKKASLKSSVVTETSMKSGGEPKMAKFMKKFTALVILVIFVLSVVPMAFAEENTQTTETILSETEEITQTDGTALTNGSSYETIPSATEKDIRDTRDTINTIKEEIKEESKTSPFKVPTEKVKPKFLVKKATEKLLQAKNKYLLAKEKHTQAKEKFLEHKIILTKLKKQAETCQGQEKPETCKESKLELKLGVRNHLIKTSVLIINSLEKLRSQIESSHVLTEEEKEITLNSIIRQQELLKIKIGKIEALTEESTNAEIKTQIKELKEFWINAKKVQRMILVELINSKLKHLVEKHSEYINSMQMRIDDLAEQGVDASELEDILAVFKVEVINLKDDYEKSENVWERLKNAEDYKTAHTKVRESHAKVREDLKETRVLVRKFMEVYKGLKPSVETAVETANEQTET